MRSVLPSLLKELYYLSFVCVLLGLPLGRALISIGFIAISACWLIGKLIEVRRDGWLKPFKIHWNKLLISPVALAILSIYLVHLIYLFNTQNYDYALHDLKIKVPLLFIPLIAPTLPRLSQQRFFVLLHVFIAGVLLSSVLSYINHQQNPLEEIRSSILFVSHIRLALMIVLSIFIMTYYFKSRNQAYKIVSLILTVWFLFFLNWLQAATGLGVLMLSIVSLLILKAYFLPNGNIKMGLMLGVVLILIAGGICGFNLVSEFSRVDPKMLEPLEEYSEGGEKYFHDGNNLQLENGFYIWRHIAERELKEGWSQRSSISFDSSDAKGNQIGGTLVRYLNSKGLKKDAQALEELGEADIRNIEAGIANYLYPEMSGMKKRIAMLSFELNAYKNGMNPSGNSFTQRIEFWRMGLKIFQEHMCFGVGTGDVADSFVHFYESNESILAPKFRLRTHNQYLTFLLTFGVFGGLWVLTMLFLPVYYHGRSFLFICFSLIVLLSFLTEDMLETQAGVSFYVIFLMVFLWINPRHPEQNKLDF